MTHRAVSDEPQSWRVWPVIKMIPADQVRPLGPAELDELRDRVDGRGSTEQPIPGADLVK